MRSVQTNDRSSESPTVLFINRVYPPAEGATGEMLADAAEGLARRGWRVSIVTGRHPGEAAVTRPVPGVTVYRSGGGAIERGSHVRRAFSYLRGYPAFLLAALRLPRHDVVVTKTDPPLQLVLGPLVGRMKGSRTVHWAQDLYPEIAVALGVIGEESPITRITRAVSTAALRRYDAVVSIGRCMTERLIGRGVSPAKISLVRNWPVESVRPQPHEENPFRQEHALTERFVVMYSGNMGLAHPFESVLNAMARLEKELPEALFLFAGGGPKKAALEAAVRERGLNNARFLPYQPKERLGESLSAADLHLVTMSERACGLVVPSKLYGVLAAGRPCVFVGPKESEAALFLSEHRCGSVVGEADGRGLAEQILYWHRHPEERQGAGERARAAVARQREESVDGLEEVLRG